MIGKPLTKITLPEDLRMLTDAVEEVKYSRTVKIFETQRVQQSGDEVTLEIFMSPVKNCVGDVIGVSTIARDLTARIKAEKALLAKNG